MSTERDQQKHKGGQGDQQQAHVATDRVSFYDESLKKQIEGSYVSDGKSIHVSSVYGAKSVPYGDLGPSIDHNAQVLLVQKLLSELARDPGAASLRTFISKRTISNFSRCKRLRLSTRHWGKKRDFAGILNCRVRPYVTMINGGTDHMGSFKGMSILFAARGEPCHQFTDGLYPGWSLDDFLRLADTLAHPGEITQRHAHASTIYRKPARI